MNDKQVCPLPPTREIHWRLRFILLPIVWCGGFLASFSVGCSPNQAIPRATAFTLSVVAGWLAYFLVKSPSRRSIWYDTFGCYNASIVFNLWVLNVPRDTWTFTEMLAIGLIRSAVFMPLMAFLTHVLWKYVSTRASGPRRRTDAEVRMPLSGDEKG